MNVYVYAAAVFTLSAHWSVLLNVGIPRLLDWTYNRQLEKARAALR